jgi:hypothetical protein
MRWQKEMPQSRVVEGAIRNAMLERNRKYLAMERQE